VLCPVSIYYFPTDDDEDGPSFKDKAAEAFRKGIDVFCIWDCCWPWVKMTELFSLIVFDPFVELFITLCIVVNTVFMALDHHDMNKDMEKALKSGNYVSSETDMKNISVVIFIISKTHAFLDLWLF
jgi:voltage-gated sodium channel type II alpha